MIQSRKCKQCGIEFTTERCAKFCSRKCLNKYKYESFKEEFICDYCGNKFIANKYNIKRHNHKYCSKDCQSSAYWEQNRNSHKVIKGEICKICSTCKEWIPLKNFWKDNYKWDDLSNVCKNCYNSYVRERWSKTKKGIASRKKGKANRRSREKQAGTLNTELIQKVMENNINRFGELTCIYCGNQCKEDWHLEHRIPLCRGGLNSFENLAISCPKCNLKKGKKTDKEFLNPVTDNTHKTSSYVVADLDDGDKFSDINIRRGVQQ